MNVFRKRMARREQYGINLIELMVVVAIIGIIGAIAYPSYLEQMRSSRRADCSGALTAMAGAMERFYSVSGSYAGATTGGDPANGPPAVFATSCPVDGGDATYNLTIEGATDTGYTLNAAPVGVQADDKCGTLTFTNTGLKGVTGAASGTTPQDCW